jgi:CRISPR-associated protein Cas5h
MNGCLIDVSGNWAHFRKPETNNNPLSHDFITKTAFVGMMGAVLGIERDEMKDLFPRLSNDLQYGVQVRRVKKESWGFLGRRVESGEKTPKQMEFLRNPNFRVALFLREEQSENEFRTFLSFLKNDMAKFTPVLGLHNCPANLSFVAEGTFEIQRGEFETKSFITKRYSVDMIKMQNKKPMRFGFERIPTFQDSNFYNPIDKYVEVIYPSEDNSIAIKTNDYFEFSKDKSKWVLV